jgi:hypothetical protein
VFSTNYYKERSRAGVRVENNVQPGHTTKELLSMYYLLTMAAMDTDGPLGRPIAEQLSLDDVWADDTGEWVGLVVKSLAVEALVDESTFRSPMRDLLCDGDSQ